MGMNQKTVLVQKNTIAVSVTFSYYLSTQYCLLARELTLVLAAVDIFNIN